MQVGSTMIGPGCLWSEIGTLGTERLQLRDDQIYTTIW